VAHVGVGSRGRNHQLLVIVVSLNWFLCLPGCNRYRRDYSIEAEDCHPQRLVVRRVLVPQLQAVRDVGAEIAQPEEEILAALHSDRRVSLPVHSKKQCLLLLALTEAGSQLRIEVRSGTVRLPHPAWLAW